MPKKISKYARYSLNKKIKSISFLKRSLNKKNKSKSILTLKVEQAISINTLFDNQITCRTKNLSIEGSLRLHQNHSLSTYPIIVCAVKTLSTYSRKQFFYSLLEMNAALKTILLNELESTFLVASIQNESLVQSFYKSKVKFYKKSIDTFVKNFQLSVEKKEVTQKISYIFTKEEMALNQISTLVEFLLQKTLLSSISTRYIFGTFSLNNSLTFFLNLFNKNKTFARGERGASVTSLRFSEYLKYKAIYSGFKARALTNLTSSFLKAFLNRKKKGYFNLFLWKTNSLNARQALYLKKKKGLLKELGRRDMASSFAVIVQRLEEKIDLFKALNMDEKKIQELLYLRQFLIAQWEKRVRRITNNSFLLIKKRKFRTMTARVRSKSFFSFVRRSLQLKNLFLRIKGEKSNIFLKKIKRRSQQRRAFQTSKISSTRSKHHIKPLYFVQRKKRWRKIKQKKISFTGKRLVVADSYYNSKETKEVLTLFTGLKTSLYFINTLSFTRFAFHLKMEKKNKLLKKKKSSLLFVQKLERDFVKKYKYVANYIEDLIRIGFISLYNKNVTFLARFLAFQIAKLPRNRRETQLIRFLIKAVKIFAAQRSEIIGLKIQFKGRVNRWRRTKAIIAERGQIPYYTYDARIEYGTATAVTRKGALGIRLWLCYNPIFKEELKETFFEYVTYSKLLKQRVAHSLSTRFQPVNRHIKSITSTR